MLKRHIISSLAIVSITAQLTSCVVLPADVKGDAPENYAKCGDITYRKELKLVDLNDEDTGYYYPVGGVILSPVLVPASLLFSGLYTLAHNATLTEEDKAKIAECLKKDLAKPAQ